MTKKATDRVAWIEQGWQPTAIGFCPSQAAWEREMQRINSSQAWPDDAAAGGHTRWLVNHKTGQSIILVVLYAASERDAFEVISTLVHEAVHAWQFLCEHIGEKSPGIEMEAYGIQHITEGLIKAYTETQGKGRDWLGKSQA